MSEPTNLVSDLSDRPTCTLCGAIMAWKCLSCGSTPELTTVNNLELEIIETNLADYAKRFTELFDQYRNAWLREMGGAIRPKHWEIDGFVLRARDIYEKAQLVDRIKQIMLKELKRKCSAEEMFDAVFKMLAENGRDKIPTN